MSNWELSLAVHRFFLPRLAVGRHDSMRAHYVPLMAPAPPHELSPASRSQSQLDLHNAYVPGVGAVRRPSRPIIVNNRHEWWPHWRDPDWIPSDLGTFEDFSWRRDVDDVYRSDEARVRNYAGVQDPRWCDYHPFLIQMPHTVRLDAEDWDQVGPSIFRGQTYDDWKWRSGRSTSDALFDSRNLLHTPRIRVQLFPFGLVQVFFSTYASDQSEDLASLLASRQSSNAAGITVGAGRFAGSPKSVASAIAGRVARAIFRDGSPRDLVNGGSAYIAAGRYINRPGNVELSAADELAVSFVSVFGRRSDDRVTADRNGSLIRVEGGHRGRVTLAWNLLHSRELAESLKFLFPILKDFCRHPSTLPSERERIVELLSRLSVWHVGFESHHRKWFYKCLETLGITDLHTSIDAFLSSQESLISAAHRKGVTVKAKRIKIEVSESSQIGSINLGSSLNNIQTYLNSSPEGLDEVARSVVELTKAIHDSSELKVEMKKELLDDLAHIARERRLTKSKLGKIERYLATAANLAGVWAAWGPPLIALVAG